MTLSVYTVQLQAFYTPSAGPAIEREVEQELGLDSLVARTVEFVDSNVVEHELGLVQQVDVEGWKNVTQDLGLIQTVDFQGPVYLSIMQPANISDEASFIYGLRAVYTPTSVLTLQQTLSLEVPVTASTALGLVQEAFVSQVVEQDLSLVQTVEWGYGIDVTQDLGLVQLAEVDALLNQTVAHTNVVEQSMTWYIDSVCAVKQYGGFHGEGGVAPTAPGLEYDSVFVIQSQSDPTDLVSLRSPETDNRYRFQAQRVNRDLLDGTLDLFQDTAWGTTETQIYTIVATKRADLDSLFTFLNDNLAESVIIKDWKGVSWDVVITNPGEIYTEDSEARWTLDFEVVGDRVDGEWVSSALGLGDTLSRAGSLWTRGPSDTNILTQTVGFVVTPP